MNTIVTSKATLFSIISYLELFRELFPCATSIARVPPSKFMRAYSFIHSSDMLFIHVLCPWITVACTQNVVHLNMPRHANLELVNHREV